jgi:hypothetical protein
LRKSAAGRTCSNATHRTPKICICPPEDGFAHYCRKMATGSGKTKVMALAIAWQDFNALREQDEIAKDYAKTFLLIAPNVIVLTPQG